MGYLESSMHIMGGHIFSIIQNVSDLGKSVKNILRCNGQSRVLPRLELRRHAIPVCLMERDSDRGTHLEQLCCVGELKGQWEAAPHQSEDGGDDLFTLVSNNNPV